MERVKVKVCWKREQWAQGSISAALVMGKMPLNQHRLSPPNSNGHQVEKHQYCVSGFGSRKRTAFSPRRGDCERASSNSLMQSLLMNLQGNLGYNLYIYRQPIMQGKCINKTHIFLTISQYKTRQDITAYSHFCLSQFKVGTMDTSAVRQQVLVWTGLESLFIFKDSTSMCECVCESVVLLKRVKSYFMPHPSLFF